VNDEIKEHSKQRMHTHSPNKLKKFKQTSARKLLAAVFWDKKGVLVVDLMQQGTTIMSEVYCKTQKILRKSIQIERHGMLAYGVVLLHDNARLPTAART
jgi:hypothetical protein